MTLLTTANKLKPKYKINTKGLLITSLLSFDISCKGMSANITMHLIKYVTPDFEFVKFKKYSSIQKIVSVFSHSHGYAGKITINSVNSPSLVFTSILPPCPLTTMS